MYLSLLLCLANTGGLEATNGVHTPHPVVSGIAFGERTSGDDEMVLISRDDARVMSSLDDGYTFTPVAGDGLGKVDAHRVVYYEVPATGEPVFIIGTEDGMWKYQPDTGAVTEISTGLDPVDRYITDMSAPDPGEDGPVVAINSEGNIYRLDEATDTWVEMFDTVKLDTNAVIRVVPNFDRNAVDGPKKTIVAGSRGLLLVSEDGGVTWDNPAPFDVVALSVYELQITSLAFDEDYENSGVMLVGRGRRDDFNAYNSEGDLWRTADYCQTFSQISLDGSTTITSGLYSIECAGVGADSLTHWYATLYRYPMREDYESAMQTYGVLHSTDGGLTWGDQGSFQEFLQDRQVNEDVAVSLPYRRMMQIGVSPDFATDGTLWVARSEGLYVSFDQGVTWGKRRVRPATQVRGISSGYNHRGEVITHGATYGSGIYVFNHTTGDTETLIGLGVSFYASMGTSPRSSEDGLVLAGGSRDLMIYMDDPAPNNLQKFFSVNDIRKKIDGDTNYVRTLAISPNFGGPGVNNPGDQAFAWSSRFDNSSLGETRMTVDGLDSVFFLNDVYQQPGQRAPYMHSMGIAPSFDAVNLPRETDIYGMSSATNSVFHLLNNGTAVAPVFEWDELSFVPASGPVAIELDPRFDRLPGGHSIIWVLCENDLYAIEDTAGDWSTMTVTQYPGIEDYLAYDLALAPDMDLRPAIYAMTWGGGVFKLDLSAQAPSWSAVGSAFPPVWGEEVALSPDFENDRLVFAGTQDGLWYCEDRAGAQWQHANNDVLYDSSNPSFDYYSPDDPTNPDSERPWGWETFSRKDIPKDYFDFLEVFGSNMIYSTRVNDYVEFTTPAATKISYLSFKGPTMGTVRVTAWDTDSGNAAAPFHDQTIDLFKTGDVENFELEVPVTSASIYTVRVQVSSLDAGEAVYIDGVRVTNN